MDRIRLGAILLAVFSIAFAACAASAAKLKVPAEGKYLYWIDYKDQAGKPQATNPEKFEGKQVDLDFAPLGEKFTDAKLTIEDLETGNAAVKPLTQDKEEKELVLTADDFQLVRNVELTITSKEGKPIESALVSLTDAENKSFSQVVDPAALGTARFTNIAAGQVTVTALYEGRKKTWDVEVPADRETPVFSTSLKIAGKVRTVAVPGEEAMAESGSKPTKPAAAPKASAASGLIILLQTLVGIFIVAVIVVAIIMFLRARGVTAEASLKKLGVQFPETGEAFDSSIPAAAPAPQVDPMTCQFCGQKKDASGNCACSVLGTPAPAGAASANGGEPRLIGTQGAYAGSIFPLGAESVSIGREESNMIPLPQDTTTSRRHANISRVNGGYVIRDEGSSNGTFVNGVKIAGSQPLRPGDEVQVGSSRFRFETS